MHRLLYSAAPLLAGSLAMSSPLASPLTEYCDRSVVRTAAGSGDAASNAPRCPFCRMPAAATHGGDTIPLHPPLWHRAIPANAAYPKQATSDPGTQTTRGADGLKVCLTCHDGALAGMLSSAAPAANAEIAPDSASDKRNVGGPDRP